MLTKHWRILKVSVQCAGLHLDFAHLSVTHFARNLFQFSYLPGHFPIPFDELIQKMPKKLEKIDILGLLNLILRLQYKRI